MNAKTRDRQERILTRFIEVYCGRKHSRRDGLCPRCSELLAYAKERLARCPMDPKPRCKDCKVHCYQAPYRGQIGEVMRFSGIHFVKRGRLDWLVRYFLS